MVLMQAILHTTDYNGRSKSQKLFYYPDTDVPQALRTLSDYSRTLGALHPLWELHIDLMSFNVDPGLLDLETLERLGITPLEAL